MPEANGNDTKKLSLPPGTYAMYVRRGPLHGVVFRDIHVLITNEDSVWLAQGLEIDYTAQGTSFDDVKKRFESGLRFTLIEHLKTYGEIDRVFQIAPQEYWDKYREQVQKLRYTFLSVLNVPVPQDSSQSSSSSAAGEVEIPPEEPESLDLKVEYSGEMAGACA